MRRGPGDCLDARAPGGSPKHYVALSPRGQCGIENANDPVDFDAAADAGLLHVLGNHIFALDHDKAEQLSIVGGVGAKPAVAVTASSAIRA